MKNEELDKLFADKLQHLETKVPNHIWEGVQNQLDTESPKVKKLNTYWKIIAVAASLLFVFGISFYYYQSTAVNEEIVEEQLVKIKDQNTTNSIVEKEIAAEAPSIRPSKSPMQLLANRSTPIKKTARVPKKESAVKAMEEPIVEIEKKELEINEMKSVLASYQPIELSKEHIDSIDIPKHFTLAATTNIKLEPEANEVKTRQGFLTTLLNTVSSKLINADKEIQFRNDEEGSLILSMTK